MSSFLRFLEKVSKGSLKSSSKATIVLWLSQLWVGIQWFSSIFSFFEIWNALHTKLVWKSVTESCGAETSLEFFVLDNCYRFLISSTHEETVFLMLHFYNFQLFIRGCACQTSNLAFGVETLSGSFTLWLDFLSLIIYC